VGNRWRRLGLGFIVGFGSLLIAALLSIAAGARSFNTGHTLPAIAGHVVNATLAAIVVAMLEELFFRGAIFGALRKSFDWHFALFLSSGIYALVHFLKRPPVPEAVTWVSGLVSLAQMLRGFVEVAQLIPAFFTLLLAGWILGMAFQRTGSLYVSIGLHAGWIFWLKSYGFLTKEQPGASQWLWGTNKLIDGWIAVLVLGIVLTSIRYWLKLKPDTTIPRLSKLIR
jgi:membrane protease YdiL (CAAX protease family)